MPTYEVETDQGTFQLEVDQPVPEGEPGQRMLEGLVAEQLQAEAFERRNYPVKTAVGDIGRGIVGGVRDFGQQFIDLPVDIFNAISELYLSPDPPGGPRRRMVEDLQAPQLPDVGEQRSGLEQGVRTGTTIATDVLVSTFAVPALRRAFLTKLLGSQRGVPLMFEPGATAARAANRFEKGVKTLAEVTTESILDTPPSTGAHNLSRLVFDFNASDIPKMTLTRAINARKRILTKIPDFDLQQSGGPLGELLERLEAQILRHR
jgi:hypothetical protein